MSMKPTSPLLLSGLLIIGFASFCSAGTWSDHFSGASLGSDWQGDRDAFSVVNGALDGISAAPVAPVPLRRVVVGKKWTNFTVQCWVEVVTPNLLVCTKGALVLRDDGNDGYVFALHVATGTIEVYRLANQEMLLLKQAPLELKRWYRLRAELRGEILAFSVDDQLIGTVTDKRNLSGAVGVAVQDTMETLFKDFTVTGPGIPSNGLELSVGQKITLTWPSSLTNYVLKATSDLSAAGTWSTVGNAPTSLGDQLGVTLDTASGTGFFMLAPKNP